MLAVEFESGRIALNERRPLSAPAEGEVLVRVLRAGICETDLQLLQGYMNFRGVPGHEFVGVAESGSYRGRRVVGEINCSCGECEFCREGLGNHCPRRSVLGILNREGAFAEYLTLPQKNLHPVPDDVSTDEAVFTEPLAAAFQIPAQLPLDASRRVVILGDGRLGNLCAQVIARLGCRLTVVGKHAEKLALLRTLGIETALLADADPDRSADVVVDCTGAASGLEAALRFVRPRGTVVLKTTVAGAQSTWLAPIVIDEITVIGSRCGPFAPALEALRKREVSVAPLISARFPLRGAAEAFAQARTSSALKILLEVSE